MKYMVSIGTKRYLKEIRKKQVFPRVCSENTSHDGCPESQVSMAR